MSVKRCPHEERETREGTWTAAVDYRFHCRCPDRAGWSCGDYTCLCSERQALPVD